MLALIAVVFAVLVLAGLIRMAWRFLHDNEEPEAGGSFSRQFFGRR